MTQQAPSLLPVRSYFLPIDLWRAPRPPQAGGPKSASHRFYLQLPTGPSVGLHSKSSASPTWKPTRKAPFAFGILCPPDTPPVQTLLTDGVGNSRALKNLD
ncbi:Atp-Dependent Rna Helicase Dhx57-Like [Manis pentadactyla]|nr:Atp-Dependent Rna Helicase Dhx57-Like [Manis pentadactyla]